MRVREVEDGMGEGWRETVHGLVTRLATDALTGQTVLITGASRGLGLDLARLLAARGVKLAICARDPDEVERARRELERPGAAVFATVCDATDRDAVQQLVRDVLARFGSLDMLITCAATIQVGPVEMMTQADVEEALAQIFWSAYHPTMAALPYMRERRQGRIVHVSSFGGKLGLPHMLPYCTAKFALTGFSASLRSELARDNITVTTVTPGLLRTGAHMNAPYKGQHEKEFLWFSAGLTLPIVSLASESAARRILKAAIRGRAEVALTAPIRALVVANAVTPGLMARLLALQNRLLPTAHGGSTQARRGMDVAAGSRSRLVRAIDKLGRANAQKHHAYPGPIHVAEVRELAP
jgi:NAD(P)-dependent dehydrogenase (short-subunit alcohol dehydrogenase family)